jgi:demethoxyubiquinone hydroxylase (CLK1/Coq7/Cat5 family)
VHRHAFKLCCRDKHTKISDEAHEMLRVDHAGEFGANRIYAGQLAVLGNANKKLNSTCDSENNIDIKSCRADQIGSSNPTHVGTGKGTQKDL